MVGSRDEIDMRKRVKRLLPGDFAMTLEFASIDEIETSTSSPPGLVPVIPAVTAGEI